MRFEGEYQGDVDVDALADQRFDGRYALRRRGHLDHDVGTVDVGEEPARLVDRLPGIVRQQRADLERREPVRSARPVVHRTQEVRRVADVGDGQRLEYLAGGLADLCQTHQLVVVVGRLGDGLVEDGRVRGEARNPVVDKRSKSARLDHGPADVVVPDRLSHIPEALNRRDHAATPPCSPAAILPNCSVLRRSPSGTPSPVRGRGLG